jgi:hypothetical protein
MLRTLYTLCLVTLIGSTGWAAASLQSERQRTGLPAGLVILTALQR